MGVPLPIRQRHIDRINNELGYGPDNCRWADKITQANNRRGCVFVSHEGQTLTVAQWAKALCIDYELVRARVRQGWTIADLIKDRGRESKPQLLQEAREDLGKKELDPAYNKEMFVSPRRDK